MFGLWLFSSLWLLARCLLRCWFVSLCVCVLFALFGFLVALVVCICWFVVSCLVLDLFGGLFMVAVFGLVCYLDVSFVWF